MGSYQRCRFRLRLSRRPKAMMLLQSDAAWLIKGEGAAKLVRLGLTAEVNVVAGTPALPRRPELDVVKATVTVPYRSTKRGFQPFQ